MIHISTRAGIIVITGQAATTRRIDMAPICFGMPSTTVMSKATRRFSYQNSYAYQDANYGYGGYYVPQDEYNYYFRQGFRRGYEDGYYSRYRYGSYSNGKYTILGALLGSIIDMQSLR
jgi:uncharacterized membrane-anchored protein